MTSLYSIRSWHGLVPNTCFPPSQILNRFLAWLRHCRIFIDREFQIETEAMMSLYMEYKSIQLVIRVGHLAGFFWCDRTYIGPSPRRFGSNVSNKFLNQICYHVDQLDYKFRLWYLFLIGRIRMDIQGPYVHQTTGTGQCFFVHPQIINVLILCETSPYSMSSEMHVSWTIDQVSYCNRCKWQVRNGCPAAVLSKA